jgi:hypothetical protein
LASDVALLSPSRKFPPRTPAHVKAPTQNLGNTINVSAILVVTLDVDGGVVEHDSIRCLEHDIRSFHVLGQIKIQPLIGGIEFFRVLITRVFPEHVECPFSLFVSEGVAAAVVLVSFYFQSSFLVAVTDGDAIKGASKNQSG